jgi:membrane-bound lytic murein transglycosylase A
MSRAVRPVRRLLAAGVLGLGVSACAPAITEPPAEPEPRLDLLPIGFEQLAGWSDDDPRPALAAFDRSCAKLATRPDHMPMGMDETLGRVGDWQAVCAAAGTADVRASAAAARAFVESWFTPFQVTDGGDPEGLFTGYYEPLLFGSRRRGGSYTIPLRRPPDDLVSVELGRFNPELAGYTIRGRIENGQFLPYYSRGEIESGATDGTEFLWVDDPIDKFFLQIQGSGQVRLDDGELIRVGYAGQNGHPYRAIGRDLIEIGAIEREQVSLQSIHAWLTAHPEDAPTIMARNRSYVFFVEREGLGPDDGPLGAQGVPLTPGRSIAVDLHYLPLGVPLWLDTTAPYPDGDGPLRRLVIAQDTGGAIKGIARADVFWGAGERAEFIAGHMKSRGRLVLLLPRSLVPVG